MLINLFHYFVQHLFNRCTVHVVVKADIKCPSEAIPSANAT